MTESKWAYRWACDIGDQIIMIERITEPHWARLWAARIGDTEYLLKRFPVLSENLEEEECGDAG